jgi:hypothetical protein
VGALECDGPHRCCAGDLQQRPIARTESDSDCVPADQHCAAVDADAATHCRADLHDHSGAQPYINVDIDAVLQSSCNLSDRAL